MGILLFLQDLRFPVLDKIMLALTTFGEETALLVVALIVFWCIDKKKGYYILFVGFIGMVYRFHHQSVYEAFISR